VYELWLSVHIVCAVLWVGGGVAVHVLGRMYMRGGDVAAMLDFNRKAISLGNRLYAPAALVLIVAGVLLVEEVGYEYGSLWIVLGFLGWILSFVVGIGFYAREGKKIDAAVAAEGASSETAVARIRRVLLVNSVEVLILVLVVVDMAVKPD
jgi:uncharacterized membrane protein